MGGHHGIQTGGGIRTKVLYLPLEWFQRGLGHRWVWLKGMDLGISGCGSRFRLGVGGCDSCGCGSVQVGVVQEFKTWVGVVQGIDMILYSLVSQYTRYGCYFMRISCVGC